jgi:hypothetical protein
VSSAFVVGSGASNSAKASFKASKLTDRLSGGISWTGELAVLHRSMTHDLNLQHLSDRALLAETTRAAAGERRATGHLVALLSEVDARTLYLGQGCSSLFTYCTQVLHLSEHAAYARIEAARAARRFPLVLDRLVSGELTLTAVGLLRQHLTTENHREILDAARHKSKREIELLVAGLSPKPAVPNSIRRLPSATANTSTPLRETLSPMAPSPVSERVPPAALPRTTKAVAQPLAPERYKLQVTISSEAHTRLREVQDLMRHQVPDGDLGVIVERAISVLAEQLQRKKLAATRRPRIAGATQSRTRHVPARVRREVWTRDEGRCAFVGEKGRCTETGFLEFHHLEPFARGGPTTAENLALRCRRHNTYEETLSFGERELPVVREYARGWAGTRSGPSRLDLSARTPADAARAAAGTGRAAPPAPYGHPWRPP